MHFYTLAFLRNHRMLKRMVSKVGKPLMKWYLSKPRTFKSGSMELKIFSGVFHPGFFFSTQFLLQYLLEYELNEKKLLELGAGSGFISFVAESKGAAVTASDVSEAAIHGLQFNKKNLGSGITIIHSDLFDQIPEGQFHFIIINPPYYPKNAADESQRAWYCGEHFEYFQKLFLQLRQFAVPFGRIIMVLSEDCDILTISKIGEQHGFTLKQTRRKKIWWEWNYIFEIV